jgi:spore germination protein
VKKNLIRLFLACVAVAVGLGGATVFLKYLPALPFHPTHQIFSRFGIRKPRIIGFLPYWTVGKGEADYSPYLTDVSYFGVMIDSDGKIVHKVNSTEEEPGWTKLQSDSLKNVLEPLKKKHVQTSLLVHGGSEKDIAALMEDPEGHANTFLNEIEPLMKEGGFTDLNLDIESFTPASPSAQQRFTAFAQVLKSGLQQRQLGTLSVDIAPSVLTRPLLIDPAQLHTYADQVILMGYDFHYRGSYVSGPVGPAGGGGQISEYDIEQSLQSLATMFPSEKTILGLPFYGYEWDTVSDRPGSGVVPGTGKTMTSAQIESLLQKCATCSAQINPLAKEPYIIIHEPDGEYYQQIFYENAASVQEKINLAQKYNLGGVAMWALGQENHSLLEPLAAYKQTFTRLIGQ